MDCAQYLTERLELLEKRLAHINKLAAEDALPDATITATGLKITPIETSIPKNAKSFVDKATALLPHVKITELLLEVDQWTNFTEHFTHLKSNEIAEDKTLLLTAILADGINLGLSKMSQSCPSVTYSKLSWLQDWHIRDETYSAALAVLTNAQLKAMAQHLHQMVNLFKQRMRLKAKGKSIPKMALTQIGNFIRTLPTNTHHSVPELSMLACVMPPTFWTVCCITNRIYALKNITRIHRVLRIKCLA